MEKVRKYSSFDEMKETAIAGTVGNSVLREREEKFKRFIDFLRGDDVPEKAHEKAENRSE